MTCSLNSNMLSQTVFYLSDWVLGILLVCLLDTGRVTLEDARVTGLEDVGRDKAVGNDTVSSISDRGESTESIEYHL